MTICGFCSRGLARHFLPKLACRLKPNKCKIWSTGSWPWRRARAAICWRPSCATERGNIAKNSPSCANKAFNASKSTVRFMIWTSRPRSTKNFATTLMWSSTGLWCAEGSKHVWPIVSARP